MKLLNVLDSGLISTKMRALNFLSAHLDNTPPSQGAPDIVGNTIESMKSGQISSSFEGVNGFVDNMGQTGVSLGQKIGIYAVAIIILVTGVAFLVHGGNANKTSEVKSSLVPKVIGAIMIFGVFGLLAFLQGIGVELFTVSS